MKIQNAPLSKEQLERIKLFVVDMNNRNACKAETGIDTRTIHTIIKRKWGAISHIKKLLDYCDAVEKYATTELNN